MNLSESKSNQIKNRTVQFQDKIQNNIKKDIVFTTINGKKSSNL